MATMSSVGWLKLDIEGLGRTKSKLNLIALGLHTVYSFFFANVVFIILNRPR
jgi:hypothetical protein